MNEPHSNPLPEAVIQAIHNGRKIDAIKRLRESSGMGLKDAKEAVERYIGEHPERVQERSPTSRNGIPDVAKVAIVLVVAYVAYRLLS